MAERNGNSDAAGQAVDERAIAKKYGLRELVYPDADQVKALTTFLASAVETGRCGAVPKTAAVVMLEFLQGTVNRQHITKAPSMSADEFDAIQAPYYIAARIIGQIQRARRESGRAAVYQQTFVSLNQFMQLLRTLIDPASTSLRLRALPDPMRDSMDALREFLALYPQQRRKGRAL